MVVDGSHFFMKGSENLKGKLLKALLVLCLCFFPVFGVYAEEKTEEPTSKSYYFKGTGRVDDYPTSFECELSNNGNYIYLIRQGVEYYIMGKGTCTVSKVFCSNDVGGPWDNTHEYGSFELGNDITYRTKIFGSTYICTIDQVSTNIPIFKYGDNESIKKYIESGDTSGAENEYDISQPDQDDSIELPKNVRTYGNVFETALRQASLQGRQVKYNAMTVRWDPPEDVESYSYDVKIQCTYSITSNSNLSATGRIPDLSKSETTSAVMIVTDYPYANRGIYDLTTGKEIARGENQPEDCVINEESLKKLTYSCDFENVFPTKLKIWIRNRKGNKCSNWVAVTSNASQVSGSDSKASVEDDNGNKVDNDTYNDTPIDNSDKHTYYDTDPDTSSTESPKFSLKEFYSYLKSGFGLLGNNGLIAFFAKSFSFIPSNIWSLITGGVAVMIIVGIINFALKR